MLTLDLDGTLVDNSERHYWSYCRSVEAIGSAPLEFDEYWAMKRDARLWPEILERTHAAGAYAEFRARWAEVIECDEALAMDRLFPYAELALDELSARFALALVTLRHDRERLAQQLDRLGLAQRFLQVFAGDQETSTSGVGSGGKELLLRGAVERYNAILAHVGDTDGDVAAAKSLGLMAVAVTSGIRSVAVLMAAEPQALCDDLSEVPGVMLDLLGR